MKRWTFAAMLPLALLMASPAAAGGNHAGGHDTLAIGKAGNPAKAKRTVEITMQETDEGMTFEPASISAKKGETVRLVFRNKGEIEHEFVMDEEHALLEHKALMERFPEMEHDDPNALRLAPGEAGEIVWQFAKAGEFSFGCLIPGHYESGMRGQIAVK